MTTIAIGVDKECYNLIREEKQRLEKYRYEKDFNPRQVSMAMALRELFKTAGLIKKVTDKEVEK